MPELPEVETMVRGLRPVLADQVLSEIRVHDPFLLQGCTEAEIERRGRGAGVLRVGRRGKWVVLELAQSRGTIVIQPRMTGGFWLVSPPRPDHVRLTFHLKANDRTIWFCDTRRLGKIAWYESAELAEQAFRKSQGPDATEILLQEFSERIRKTDRGIKPALMDQKILAGIGNIYADETLFRARIHPERKASSLSAAELGQLHSSIGSVLREAIEAEGSSFDAGYRTVLGLEGGFLNQNAMYGHGGEPCPSCKTPILKTKIAGLIGRPTHYCPTCQPLKTKRSKGSQTG